MAGRGGRYAHMVARPASIISRLARAFVLGLILTAVMTAFCALCPVDRAFGTSRPEEFWRDEGTRRAFMFGVRHDSFIAERGALVGDSWLGTAPECSWNSGRRIRAIPLDRDAILSACSRDFREIRLSGWPAR